VLASSDLTLSLTLLDLLPNSLGLVKTFLLSRLTTVLDEMSDIMFFFFFGGVEPRIRKTIQLSIGPCPFAMYHKKIGLENTWTVDLVNVSNVATLYFIPLWTVGSTHRMVHCRECGYMAKPEVYDRHILSMSEGKPISANDAWGRVDDLERLSARSCQGCGGSLKDGWTFCIRCGSHT